MNNIISKSSVCPYILEGCIVNLRNCYIGQKLTEKGSLSSSRNAMIPFKRSQHFSKGVDTFSIFMEKVWIFQQPETESNWKYYAQHAQKLNQEGAVINRSELAN